MARTPRAFEPGGIYHVISRGNNRESVFLDDHDRRAMLSLLANVARRHRWVVLAHCLMTTHYHQIVRVPFLGLSAGMQVLNTGHARRTNRRYGRIGHLFQNRFHASAIEREAHLLEACRYVVLNPVRAGICASPADWSWSSYRACAGLDLAPPFLAETEVLKLFASDPERARAAYRRFVLEGHGPVSDTVTEE